MDCGLNLYGSGQGLLVGFCEHDKKPSSFVKGGKFIDQLRVFSASEEGLFSMGLRDVKQS